MGEGRRSLPCCDYTVIAASVFFGKLHAGEAQPFGLPSNESSFAIGFVLLSHTQTRHERDVGFVFETFWQWDDDTYHTNDLDIEQQGSIDSWVFQDLYGSTHNRHEL